MSVPSPIQINHRAQVFAERKALALICFAVREKKRFQTVCLMAMVSLLLVGCGPKGEVREYVVKSEGERVFTSDLLKSEFGVIPFTWEVPDLWKLAGNDQFSKVAWTVGSTEDQARITISDLPVAAGLVPQISRWRGQIGITLAANHDPMQGTETVKLDGGSGTYVAFTGEEETILGLMVPLGDNLWIFKYRSSNAVADQQKERFRKFCESAKIPATQGDK